MNQVFPCPVSGLFETVWQLFFYFSHREVLWGQNDFPVKSILLMESFYLYFPQNRSISKALGIKAKGQAHGNPQPALENKF